MESALYQLELSSPHHALSDEYRFHRHPSKPCFEGKGSLIDQTQMALLPVDEPNYEPADEYAGGFAEIACSRASRLVKWHDS